MTIQHLEQQLIQRLQQRTTHSELAIEFPRPHRLLRCLEHIERRFDELENSKPAQDKILASIEKLEKAEVSQLTRRDWRNIAWGMCIQFPTRAQKLIFLSSGRDGLDHIKTVGSDLIPSIYTALLFSYFALDKNELNQNPNNWLILREILYDGLADLYVKYKRPKDWMLILSDYTELLQTQPTKRLSLDFINSADEKKIPDIADKLHISANSWFWDKLVTGAVKSVCDLADGAFVEKIDRLLNLAAKNPIYGGTILAQTLDRYATSQFRDQIHEELKKTALAQWGNPQYESAAGWTNVKPDTKQMMTQWFVRADLEAFFKLFSAHADINRFNYWMGFITKISFSQLFLSPNALQSKRSDHQEFRKNNKGRYKSLVGSTFTNNAFLLKIGNIYVVDFSDTGNACYMYEKMPYKDNDKEVAIFELKNKRTCLAHLSHSGLWENRFNEELAGKGLFPDNHNAFNTGYKRY